MKFMGMLVVLAAVGLAGCADVEGEKNAASSPDELAGEQAVLGLDTLGQERSDDDYASGGAILGSGVASATLTTENERRPPVYNLWAPLPSVDMGTGTRPQAVSPRELDALRKRQASGERYIVMAHALNSAVDRDPLFKEVRAGNPVVVFGDTSVARGLVDAQFAEPMRSIDSNGVEESESVYGLFVDGRGVQQVFQSVEKDMASATKLAYQWATERLKADEAGEQESSLSSNDWTFVTNAAAFHDVAPYGKHNVTTRFYKLSNDNSSTYDWWNIELRHESVPGKQAWGNDWRTADMWQKVWGKYNGLNYFLVDRDPTTTAGSTTVSVSIGTSDASMSWSYSVSDVMISDQGDASQSKAQWWHNVNESTNVGMATYVAKPGATMRVPQGTSPYNYWQECYRIKWEKPNGKKKPSNLSHTVWWGGSSCSF